MFFNRSMEKGANGILKQSKQCYKKTAGDGIQKKTNKSGTMTRAVSDSSDSEQQSSNGCLQSQFMSHHVD